MELLAAVVIMTVASVLLWEQATRRDQPEGTQYPGVRIELADLTKRLGDADVVLVEFGDFQCPFCARQATGVHPDIQRQFIDAGTLSYAYVHFPLEDIHPEAIAASEAAECAGRQAKYWGMHSRLFEDPHDLTTVKFLRHARALGLDVERFQQCLGGEATERVMADRRLGLELGVRGIPAFFLGTVQTNGSVMLTEPFFGTAPPDLVSTLIARLPPVERSWWPW